MGNWQIYSAGDPNVEVIPAGTPWGWFGYQEDGGPHERPAVIFGNGGNTAAFEGTKEELRALVSAMAVAVGRLPEDEE